MKRIIVLLLAGFGIALALHFLGGVLDWIFLRAIPTLVIYLSAIWFFQLLLSNGDAEKNWEYAKQVLAFLTGCIAGLTFMAVSGVTFEKRPAPKEISEEERAEFEREKAKFERKRQECLTQHRSGEWIDEDTRSLCKLMYVLN